MDSPAADELAEFIRETQLLPLDAEFIAQERQRPEVTVRGNYILILLLVPVFHREQRLTSGAALYIVIKEAEIFTLQYRPIAELETIWKEFETNAEKQEEYFDDAALSLALYLIAWVYDASHRKLERLRKHIEIAEDAVFQGNEHKMVKEIATLTRDVMDFRRVIRPQRNLFSALLNHRLADETARAQWERMPHMINQLWDTLGGLHESVQELGQTNDSLLQHKENELLRFLTLYSILAIPILLLVDPPVSVNQGDVTAADMLVSWGAWVVLVGLLALILLRFRGKRIF